MATAKTLLGILELDTEVDHFLERVRLIADHFEYDVHLALAEPDSSWLPAGWAVSGAVKEIIREFDQARNALVEEHATTLRDAGIEVSTSILTEKPVADEIFQLIGELDPDMLVKATRYHSAAERSMFVDTDWQLMRVCPCPIWFVKSAEVPDNPQIIAAVDPSHAHDKPAAMDDAIVRTALSVAEKFAGEAHLLHTYIPVAGVAKIANRTFKPTRLSVEDIDREVKAEHRRNLDALAARHEVPSNRVHQLPGRASEIIPAFARTRKSGLVVMGALARWGLKRMVIGSTAERTLDLLPCDVLIVHPGDNPANQ